MSSILFLVLDIMLSNIPKGLNIMSCANGKKEIVKASSDGKLSFYTVESLGIIVSEATSTCLQADMHSLLC